MELKDMDMKSEIVELNISEVGQVSGGNLPLLGSIGAVLAFGYQMGKDMAARDALQCHVR